MRIPLHAPRTLITTLCALTIAACGDDDPGIGPPIARADSLFIVAHLDDDMIFMQPELIDALAHGSSTTIYVLSGDPVRGNQRARFVFEAAMIAYEHAAGSSDWECGSLRVTDLPVHHCRLRNRPISMIGLDIVDGGYSASERPESLLSLLEGRLTTLPILGPVGGQITVPLLIDELAALIAQTAPSELHVLDIMANHGNDHAGHLMAAAFALWGAAQAGFQNTLISHRGYSVDPEPVNLSDADFALTKPMLGYFEACYFECGPCGTECATIADSHERYLRRQYSTIATPGGSDDQLESLDTPGQCLADTGSGLALADCGDPGVLQLDRDHHLRRGELCAASGTGNDNALALVRCADEPSQYWVVPDEGYAVNGRSPLPEPDMRFHHTRCLEALPGMTARAPVCGVDRLPRWRIRSGAERAQRRR